MKQGSNTTLFDYLIDQFGSGEVIRPVDVVDETTTIVHRVRFFDEANQVIFDRRGEKVSLVYMPLPLPD